jgi:hypothetical protein
MTLNASIVGSDSNPLECAPQSRDQVGEEHVATASGVGGSMCDSVRCWYCPVSVSRANAFLPSVTGASGRGDFGKKRSSLRALKKAYPPTPEEPPPAQHPLIFPNLNIRRQILWNLKLDLKRAWNTQHLTRSHSHSHSHSGTARRS